MFRSRLAFALQDTLWRSGPGSLPTLPFLFTAHRRGLRIKTLLQRHLDSIFLMLYINFIYSRAFQRMGLLHRLDWEQKGSNGEELAALGVGVG